MILGEKLINFAENRHVMMKVYPFNDNGAFYGRHGQRKFEQI